MVPVATRRDDALETHSREMLRDDRLRSAAYRLKLMDRRLAVAQAAEKKEPLGMRQRLEKSGDPRAAPLLR